MADEVMTGAVLTWDHPFFMSYRMKVDYLRVAFACEEFGDMLGICNETCEEVKRQILDSQDIALPALRVLIGFSDRDVTCYLSSKIGGLKFLALVCALVTAFSPEECAHILAKLISHHLKREEDRYPTAEELRPLISAIDTRCQLSGFAERIVDYEIAILHCLRDRFHDAASLSRLGKTPDMDAVIKIVDLLLLLQANNTRRPNIKALSIQAGLCAPWIAAFLRWWLNQESTICLEGDDSSLRYEKLVHGSTQIGIKLAFPTDQDSPHYVRIRELHSDAVWKNRYFAHGRAAQYRGLISIPTFFRLALCALHLDRGAAHAAARDVLPFAVSDARKGLAMCSGGCVARGRWGAPCAHAELQQRHRDKLHVGGARAAAHEIYTARFEPFPPRPRVNRVLRLVPGCAGAHMRDLRSKLMGTPLHAHAAAAEFLAAGERGRGAFESQFAPLREPGGTTLFEEQIAHLAALVLALALFEGVEGLGVRPDPLVWRARGVSPSSVVSAICRVFRGGRACCDVLEWHRVCRALAGADGGWREEEEGQKGDSCLRDDTVISCDGGQAVWPAVAFEGEVPQDGESYLRLHWRRGNIYDQHDLRRHRRVVGVDSRVVPSNVPRRTFELPSRLTMLNISASENCVALVRDKRSQDRGILKCALAKHSGGAKGSMIYANPSSVIKTLASAERIEACLHRPDAPMDIPTPFPVSINTTTTALPDVYLCTPEDALPWYWDWAGRINQVNYEKNENDNDNKEDAAQHPSALIKHALCDTGSRPGAVAVVPAAGDEAARVFALAKPVGAHVAVRQRACVECCVRFCRDFGFDILVL
ncbi:hypothetical protein F4781DRAFT_438957 [Annulohypoxylon bovei var. microspora]|nr:hypothetical protein F4781DRAFT_438957 [Annulohypoxylon bovei var. microspora]